MRKCGRRKNSCARFLLVLNMMKVILELNLQNEIHRQASEQYRLPIFIINPKTDIAIEGDITAGILNDDMYNGLYLSERKNWKLIFSLT